MNGTAGRGLTIIREAGSTAIMTSFRIVNNGTESATITLFVTLGSETVRITPDNMRLDPGEAAIEPNANTSIGINQAVILYSDKGSLTWTAEFA